MLNARPYRRKRINQATRVSGSSTPLCSSGKEPSHGEGLACRRLGSKAKTGLCATPPGPLSETVPVANVCMQGPEGSTVPGQTT